MKVALAGLLVCLAGRAAADPRPPISLRLEPSVEACVAGETAAVRQAVAIELGTALVDDDENPAAQVSVTCVADEATIQIHSSLTDRTTVRRLVLAGEPVVSRPRLLGLAIAETVAASWAEPETPATIAATPATLPASPAAAILETPTTIPAPPAAAIPDTSKTPPASPASRDPRDARYARRADAASAECTAPGSHGDTGRATDGVVHERGCLGDRSGLPRRAGWPPSARAPWAT